ncbi:MAG: hypothetical protein HYU56_02340 [Candidatus Aenigmarchaeota archaeon]|nr:hypothetical protein [Candidatus Aenigmarchaeota archaeon]
MPFLDRVSTHVRQPLRVYFHEAGYVDAFGRLPKKETLIHYHSDSGLSHVLDIFATDRKIFKLTDFLIAALWGDDGDIITEVFGYSGTDPWPGNPEVRSWVFRDGIYQRRQRPIACGETLIVLGREEEARIKSPNLQHYMDNPPDVRDLMRS